VDPEAAVTVSEHGGLSAALLQLSQHAERIGALDGRESQHYLHVGEALAALDTAVNGLRGTVTDHGEILASLDGISDAVAVVADQVASLLPPNPGPGYRPIPAVQWWAIGDEEREEALTRLHDWVGRIYRPHYGHLATLGECWKDHPLCLVQLDWLSELWSVLYLQPTRSARDLAAQAEFGTRIVPAISEQLAVETSRCTHRRTTAAANGRAGAR
jgi:hypothetical protein